MRLRFYKNKISLKCDMKIVTGFTDMIGTEPDLGSVIDPTGSDSLFAKVVITF